MAEALIKIGASMSEYQAAMRQAAQDMKNLSSEYSLAAAQAKLNGSATDGLRAKVVELTSKMEKQKSIVETNKVNVQNLTNTLENQQKAYKKTGQEIDETKKAYEESCKATGKNSEESQKLKAQLEKLESQYAQQERQIGKTETAMAKAKGEVTKSEAALKEMEVQLREVNAELARQNFDEYAEKANKVGTAVESFGKKMMVVTTAIAGVGAAALKTTADFDSQMSTVQSISGATADEFDALRDKAVEMGSKTAFSASEAGAAMEYMAMAGWTTQDMLDGISGVMDAAAASGEDLAMVSDILTDGLTAFGLTAADSAHFADVLVKTANSANTNVSMMGETFKYAGAVCGTLGISIEDCAIATGLMGNAGIKASNAGTALRTGLSNLVKPTDAMAAAMEEYGVAIQTTDDGSVDFMATMKNIRASLGSLDATTQAAAVSTIFGKNAMSGWSAIINATDADFQSLTDAIYSCDGAAQEAADIKLDNLSGQMTILRSTIEGIAIQIGDILMPTVRNIVARFQEWATCFSNLDEGQKKMIVKIVGIVAAIGPLLLGVGKIIKFSGSVSSVLGTLASGLSKMGFMASGASGATGLLSGVLSAIASPVGIAVAAIAALVAGLAYVTMTNDDVKKSLGEVVDMFKGSLSQAFEFISKTVIPDLKRAWDGLLEILKPLKDFVVGALTSAWQDMLIPALKYIAGTVLPQLIETAKNLWTKVLVPLGEFIGSVLKPMIPIITGYLTDLWQNVILPLSKAVGEVLKAAWEGLVKIWNEVVIPRMQKVIEVCQFLWNNVLEPFISWAATTFKPMFQTLFKTIGNIINGLKTTLIGIIDFIVGIFTLDLNKAGEGIKGIFGGLWDTIKAIFSGALEQLGNWCKLAWDAIGGTVTSIWNGIKDFFVGLWEGIKNVVSVALMFIKELIVAAFNLITLPFRFIWENCKDTIMTIWEAIKTAVSTAINAVKSVIDTVMEAIRSVITTVWNAISGAVTSVMNTIKTTFTNIWNAISATVSNIVNGVKNTITNIWNSIKTTTTNVWNGIKSAITTPIDAAKNTIKGIVDKITGFFSGMNISLPKIKLPHFSITGEFSIAPPSVPHLSIEWYKNGGIMTQPTIFGGIGSTLLGGGEAGAEAILPLAQFYNTLSHLLDEKLDAIQSNSTVYVYVTLDGEVIAQKTAVRVENKLVKDRLKKR